ncbi:MAG TPA: alpha/beta fold hydrolase [Thermodesulfobacteriota bacterium]|nr:alpha/beta fold hydrolase [Thermodesulfobacteriota bacterium]
MSREEKRLISFRAEDGFLLNALLLTKSFNNEEVDLLDRPIIIHVHGVLGHFLARGTPRLLPPALLEHGISSFSVNNRMAFMGQIMGEGIFDYAIKDIDAAVDLLRKEGFRKIFIFGYSLGANIVAYHASQRPNAGIQGLILEGCAFSLPDSQRKRWEKWDSIPTYDEVYVRAREVLGKDPDKSANDQIFIVYRAWGPTFNPFHVEIFTYKTWWFMRGPEAYNAMTFRVISKIKVPILFLQGENDDILDPGEAKDLADLVHKAGNHDITVRYIPRAMHDCMENPEETVKSIVEWVSYVDSNREKIIK